MLEITADDIARLDDEQLRAVVARLCEAELRSQGLTSSSVTWGGNQTAADGGIDVRVDLPEITVVSGFVPRPATGIQVKAQDMSPSEIRNEMRPKGAIRSSIRHLAGISGAYIIVSSKGSTADTALSRRRRAMRDALSGVPNGNRLFLDFYDRTRIETWLRNHQGLIPWVRTLVGRAIPGWQSYGAWAYDPAGAAGEYLVDDKLRLHAVKTETDRGLTAIQGIQQLRDVLRRPREVIRLVGLSGVGKTRLVQALFDERVGEASLDRSLAVYTNMADEPDPQPTAMASDIVATGARAVLVIDNCPPDLHHRLSEVCRHDRSKVSLITVEYDISEDDPEGTDVFTLGPSAPELIQQLVRRRYTGVSQVDAGTIAEFSGGNARIALALAATVEHSGTVAGLTDEQLFHRLFQQRHDLDASLYLTAQACALVYSFHGEDVSESDPAELARLGRLVGKPAEEVYRAVAELKRRDLVQQRGVWRAVLPHAIANRLAATALQNVPYLYIERELMSVGAERLMRSFSRRLGYLHTSKEAAAIVDKWLAIGGLLGDVLRLNDLGRAMFENVASVAPADALAALERVPLLSVADGALKDCEDYCDLLRSLAYDPVLFERAVALMAKLVAVEGVDLRAHKTQVFASLFHLVLSGTRASIEQRVAMVDTLLSAPNENQRSLGIVALRSLLKAEHFHSEGGFEFGARSRDFGYWPQTPDEVQHWFSTALQLVERRACGDDPVASSARAALAENFCGVWLRGNSQDDIVRVCSAIREQRFWPDGWLAIRRTLDLYPKGRDPECLAKLVGLETVLRPSNLLEKVRAVVFSTNFQAVELDPPENHGGEEMSTRWRKTEALAEDLGKSVAAEPLVLTQLLPDIVSSGGRLWSFGQGLVGGTTNPRELWQRLVDALARTAEAARKPEVLRGVLRQLRAIDPELTSSLLDDAVDHDTLAEIYPFLQTAVDLSAEDVARLKRSVTLQRAPAFMYRHLAGGSVTDAICDRDLQELVLAIAALPSGHRVAIEILHMRLHSVKQKLQDPLPAVTDTGCVLLDELTFSKEHDGDYAEGQVAAFCLRGDRGAAVAFQLCQRLKYAVAKYETSAHRHSDLLSALFRVQPVAALDSLCGGDNEEELEPGLRVLSNLQIRRNALEVIQDDELLNWCDQHPQMRYPALATVIPILHRDSETAPPSWTSTALRFLERAPDPDAILRIFTSNFTPATVWSGSLAAILESNAALLDQLDGYPALKNTVNEEKERLRQQIADERRRETLWDRERDQRFE